MMGFVLGLFTGLAVGVVIGVAWADALELWKKAFLMRKNDEFEHLPPEEEETHAIKIIGSILAGIGLVLVAMGGFMIWGYQQQRDFIQCQADYNTKAALHQKAVDKAAQDASDANQKVWKTVQRARKDPKHPERYEKAFDKALNELVEQYDELSKKRANTPQTPTELCGKAPRE